jgi:RNA polymerase sigma-70 factor (ECF subfamily)
MDARAEQQLIDRCRRGDDSAFRELVEAYKGLVFGLVSRALPNPARAEDIAQEVFLRVYRGLPYFRGEARLSTWIYRIVVNLLAEDRDVRRLPTISIDAPPVGRGEGTGRDLGTADRAFDDIELKDRLQKALMRLPLHYRILVEGHYLKGQRYEDLAAALELPMGTVKTHLFRAKRLLRELLERELG